MRNSRVGNSVNIIIADDELIYRKGICQLLKNQTFINIVGEACNGEDLLDVVEKNSPHLVVTDIQMPVMDGIEATKQIKKRFPNVEIIALSNLDEDHYVFDMLEAGANEFLLKNTNKEELLTAVKAVNEKRTYYCDTITNLLVRRIAKNRYGTRHLAEKKIHFTDKEIAVIKLICLQDSTKEIASKLKLKSRCIDSVREKIQEKIGARNMVGVALFAVENGIHCFD